MRQPDARGDVLALFTVPWSRAGYASRFVYLARESGEGAPSPLVTGEVLCTG